MLAMMAPQIPTAVAHAGHEISSFIDCHPTGGDGIQGRGPGGGGSCFHPMWAARENSQVRANCLQIAA